MNYVYIHLITTVTVYHAGMVDRKGHTPLELAVLFGKLEVVKYLVKEQNIDIKGNSLCGVTTPIVIACNK